MGEAIIKVENISKRYTLGGSRGYKTFRESLVRVLKTPFSRKDKPDSFWALKEVSFEVSKGEVLGIIGRNGAGKSTLLKILSRITVPTSGHAELRGRIGSLLEVGTGFHPELSGRENVYLYGAILGMSSLEISRKYAQIVAFAELERFMDTPVKRYSSGMYMRLAFSVAVHVDPEVLLVDEVLAVGDAVFQTKCMAKMREITGKGRTVLFVSHNLAAVGSLCARAVVLDAGRLLFCGPVRDAVNFYEKEVFDKKYLQVPVAERQDRSGSGSIRLTGFRLEDESGKPAGTVLNGHTARLVFSYMTAPGGAKNVDFGFIVERPEGGKAFQFCTRFSADNFDELSGSGNIVCTIKRFPLVPGRYRIGTYFLTESSPADFIPELSHLDVADGDFYASNYQVYEKETPLLVDGFWTREPLP